MTLLSSSPGGKNYVQARSVIVAADSRVAIRPSRSRSKDPAAPPGKTTRFIRESDYNR
jgi:hypothetical protein